MRNFISNEENNYKTRRVGYCSNRVIELIQKMLILQRLVTKKTKHSCQDQEN